jgi:hypothetical protein
MKNWMWELNLLFPSTKTLIIFNILPLFLSPLCFLSPFVFPSFSFFCF